MLDIRIDCCIIFRVKRERDNIMTLSAQAISVAISVENQFGSRPGITIPDSKVVAADENQRLTEAFLMKGGYITYCPTRYRKK